MKKRKSLLDRLVRGRGSFVLNQSPKIFQDKRTKRKRTREAKKRHALTEE